MTEVEYGSAYCLFCTTGREEQVVRLIHENGWGRAIFASRIKTILRNGAWTKVPVPLIPGYVFLYTQSEEQCFDELLGLNNVIRMLAYDDGTRRLFGRDLEFADLIWRLDGQIDVMKAIQVGDRIEIVDGVFKQLHGTVVKMDRRRRTVCVSLESEGALKRIWLAYEIVEKKTRGGGSDIAHFSPRAKEQAVSLMRHVWQGALKRHGPLRRLSALAGR